MMHDRDHQLTPRYAPHQISMVGSGPYGGYYAATDFGHEPAKRMGGIDAIGLFLRVVRYRRIVAAIIAACLLLALVATFMQTAKYQATAKLEVVVPSARVFQDIEVTAESGDIRAFQTAREKLKSRALAQRVVYALNLAERKDFLFPRGDFSPGNILYRAFGLGGASTKHDLPQEALVRIATSRVMAGLKVDLVPNTSLLTIDFRDQNPTYARDIANQLAQSFIDQRIDQSSATSQQARTFIQQQVGQVKEKLQESEKALVEYAKAAGITVTGNDDSLISSNLADINKALSAAIQENLDYDRLVKQIDAGQGANLEQVLGSEALDKLRGILAEFKGAYQQKALLFKPDFPEMRQLASQIRETEKQLDLGVRAITDSIRLKYQETVGKVQDLRRKLAELEADQASYQDKNIQYTILKRDVDSNRAQYDNLIGKLNDIDVGAELKMQNAAVVDLAVAPSDPYSPNLPINLAIGLVISLLVTGAVIYVFELLNNAFSNPDQVESELGLPILGILPNVDDAEMEQQMSKPTSALSEAYRSLRTSLQFSGVDGAPATLLVTSAEPSEGKSTTVIKLAEDFASLGARILIIDADMRKPSMHRKFNEDNAIGLSNVLTNTARREDLPRLIRRAKSSNVSFMSAGTVPPNPADLLSSARMSLIVSSLRKRFDMIIIDAPPVIGLADVPILSRLADATLLVVSANKVSPKSAGMALKRLKAAGANVVGAAFTMFAADKFEYSYSYGHLRRKYHTYADPAIPLADATDCKMEPQAHVSNWSLDFVAAGLRRHFGGFLDRFQSSRRA